MKEKYCVKCGSSEFNTRGDCKPCNKERSKAFQERAKEKYKNGTFSPCKICNGLNRGPSGACRDCAKFRAREKSRLLGIPEKTKFDSESARKKAELESKKKWKDRNKDAVLKYNTEYNLRTKDIRKLWGKENIVDQRMYHRIYNSNRRKKIEGQKLSKNIASELMKKQRCKCAVCKVKLDKYHIDHIMPIALGGENTDLNVQLLCNMCNWKKNAKHPVDFMQSQGYLL